MYKRRYFRGMTIGTLMGFFPVKNMIMPSVEKRSSIPNLNLLLVYLYTSISLLRRSFSNFRAQVFMILKKKKHIPVLYFHG